MTLSRLVSPKISSKTWVPRLEACIYMIRNMPDLLMEHRHDIVLDYSGQDGDAELIQAIRKEYRNKAAWLEYYLLDRTDLLPELTFTSKVNYKFLAESTMSFLTIAQEVYPRSTLAQEQHLEPRKWMVLCEADFCEISLRNSGYTGEADPIGKRKLFEDALNYCNQMADVEKLDFVSATDGTALEVLEAEAAFIAKQDTRFRNTYYVDFLKAIKRRYRRLKESPLQVVSLDEDGSLRELDKGKDSRTSSPKKKSSKGFG